VFYRGRPIPRMNDTCIYGANGTIWGLNCRGTNWTDAQWETSGLNISAIGEGESGDIFVANYGNIVSVAGPDHPVNPCDPNGNWGHSTFLDIGNGRIYRIEDDLLSFALQPRLVTHGRLILEWQSAPE